jgi:hypothetical protein
LDPNADIGDEDIISAKDLYMNFKKMLRKDNDGVEDAAALENAAGIGADDLGKGEDSEAEDQSEDLA